MTKHIDKFKSDLDKLISKGEKLQNAINRECFPHEFEEAVEESFPDKKKRKAFIETIPSFKSDYQTWYSRS